MSTATQLFNLTRFHMGSARCHWCKMAIRGPKIVREGFWCCQTCIYYLDQGGDPPGKVGK